MPAGERYFSRRTFAFRIPPISQRYPPLINSDTRAWPFSFLLHANARASTCEDSACQLFQYLEYALPNGPHPSSLPPLLSPSLPRFSYRFFPIGLSGCVDQKTLNSEFVRWPARPPQPPPPPHRRCPGRKRQTSLRSGRFFLPLSRHVVVRGKQFSRFWHTHEPRRTGSCARPAKSAISITHNRRRPPPPPPPPSPSCRHTRKLEHKSHGGSNIQTRACAAGNQTQPRECIRTFGRCRIGRYHDRFPFVPIFLHLSRVGTGTTTTRRTTMTTTC